MRTQAANWSLNFLIVRLTKSDGLISPCRFHDGNRAPGQLCPLRTSRTHADCSLSSLQGLLFLPIRDWFAGGREDGSGTVFYLFAIVSALGVATVARRL